MIAKSAGKRLRGIYIYTQQQIRKMDFDALPRPIFSKLLLLLPPDDLYNAYKEFKTVKKFLSPPAFAEYMEGNQKPETSAFWNQYLDLWPHVINFEAGDKLQEYDQSDPRNWGLSYFYAGLHSDHPLYSQEMLGDMFSFYEDVRQFLEAAHEEGMSYVVATFNTPPHRSGALGDVFSVVYNPGNTSFRFEVKIGNYELIRFSLRLVGATNQDWTLPQFPSFNDIERVTGGKLESAGSGWSEVPLNLKAYRQRDDAPEDDLYKKVKRVQEFVPEVKRTLTEPTDVILLDDDDDPNPSPLKRARTGEAQLRRALVIESGDVEAAARLLSLLDV